MLRRFSFLGFILWVFCSALPSGYAQEGTERGRPAGGVAIVPLGSVPRDVIQDVRAALEKEHQVRVVIQPRVKLPREAYYSPRKRYRADKLLRFLNREYSKLGRGVKILGLTTVDISTTKDEHRDWGVFGLGEMGGRSCVVSTHRLKRKMENRAHLLFRVRSTAIHEVGHTFGLPHCPVSGCVMEDAEGSVRNTDTGTGKLCPRCRKQSRKNRGIL